MSKGSKKLLGPLDLIDKSIKIFRKTWANLIIMMVIPFVAIGLFLLIPVTQFFRFISLDPTFLFIMNFISALLVVAVVICYFYIVFMSQVSMMTLIHDGKNKKTLWEYLKNSRPYILPYLIISLLTTVLVLLWSLLLIIPGIMFAVYYSNGIFTMLFEKKRGMAALRRSKELVTDYWWAVAWRLIAFHLIAFVAFIPFSVLDILFEDFELIIFSFDLLSSFLGFIVGIIYLIYTYLIYKNLKKIH